MLCGNFSSMPAECPPRAGPCCLATLSSHSAVRGHSQQCALCASQPTCKHCTVYKWCTPHTSVAYVCVGLTYKYAPC